MSGGLRRVSSPPRRADRDEVWAIMENALPFEEIEGLIGTELRAICRSRLHLGPLQDVATQTDGGGADSSGKPSLPTSTGRGPGTSRPRPRGRRRVPGSQTGSRPGSRAPRRKEDRRREPGGRHRSAGTAGLGDIVIRTASNRETRATFAFDAGGSPLHWPPAPNAARAGDGSWGGPVLNFPRRSEIARPRETHSCYRGARLRVSTQSY